MEVTTVLAIIGGGGIVGLVSAMVTLWLGNRSVGLDTLKAAIATSTADLERLNARIVGMEARAGAVMNENNWFRRTHGEMEALSLESFTPLPAESRQRIVERLEGLE